MRFNNRYKKSKYYVNILIINILCLAKLFFMNVV